MPMTSMSARMRADRHAITTRGQIIKKLSLDLDVSHDRQLTSVNSLLIKYVSSSLGSTYSVSVRKLVDSVERHPIGSLMLPFAVLIDTCSRVKQLLRRKSILI